MEGEGRLSAELGRDGVEGELGRDSEKECSSDMNLPPSMASRIRRSADRGRSGLLCCSDFVGEMRSAKKRCAEFMAAEPQL